MNWMTWVQLYFVAGLVMGVLDWMFDIVTESRAGEQVPMFAWILLWPLLLLIVGLVEFHRCTCHTRGWARRK